MKPPKIIHIQNGPRNFIRFDGKPRMIIEVWKFSHPDDLLAAVEKTQNDLALMEMPYVGAATEWNGMQHLLVATQFPDGIPTAATQKEADELARIMRRLADWYRYQVLKADQN